ncbi:transposase [Bradyrhizobium sp. Pear77]|nr:transposase [Bradyrhizobium altum]
MAVGNPRRRDWLAWLARQRDWRGQPLPPHLLAEIKRKHARLMLVREQLAGLERIQAADASAAVPTPMVERRDQLQRLKALGPAFTTTLINELFYKDFRNRREVASYCGLTPSPWKSGGIDASRASARPAIGVPATRRSNWPGYGFGTKATPHLAAGSAPVPPTPATAPNALPSSRWRAT